jgi:ParB family chromosome partitioning protein
MSKAIAVTSEYRNLPLAQLQESPTNPRRRFDEGALTDLAASFLTQGVLQPLLVRTTQNDRFEVVAGARRFRAAGIAGLAEVPVRVVELSDAEVRESQLTENLLREDVHPYEEALALEGLLRIDGGRYDIHSIASRLGKSPAYITTRIRLTHLVRPVAEAFLADEIGVGHALEIAKLPQSEQQRAIDAAFRAVWSGGKESRVLLPLRDLIGWIEQNILLSLEHVPFDKDDAELVPEAGSCAQCPKRTGFNPLLFGVMSERDRCLDSNCYHSKVETFLDREIAAHPGIVQIENGWRNPKEQRPGAVQRSHVREIPTVTDNPDAEPQMPCAAAKAAIVVYGKQLGRKLTVCADKHCPVHDPQAAAEAAAHPALAMAPAPEIETEEEAAERQAAFERQRAEYEEERQHRGEERKQQFEREQAEIEAERNRKAEILKSREAIFERILENAPPMFTPAQLRVFLRALVNLDPYTLTDDVAEHFADDDGSNQRTAEEILASALTETPDEKLTNFALRIALTGYIAIPPEGELDLLAEAAAAFVPPQPPKEKKAKKTPTPIKAATKKTATKKKVAA